MIKFSKVKTWLIVALLIALAIMYETMPTNDNTKVSIDYDTSATIINNSMPKPAEPIIKYIYKKKAIDSEAVFNAYMKKVKYNQILKDDSTAYIRLQQVVSQNRVIDQKLTYIPRIPTLITYDNPAPIPRIRILAGVMLAGGVADNINTFATIGIITRKGGFYFGGYDPFHKTISIGVMFRIRPRKPP